MNVSKIFEKKWLMNERIAMANIDRFNFASQRLNRKKYPKIKDNKRINHSPFKINMLSFRNFAVDPTSISLQSEYIN